jgi:DNA-binding MarR family transcriptional regulator
VSTEPVGDGRGLALAQDSGPAEGPAAGLCGDAEIDVTRLRVALARLSRRLRRHELAGLTPTQLAALSTIGKAGPMRLGDLAAAEGIAPSTLTRLVTALEDSGYVQRTADPSDARASTLAITVHGQEALERIRAENTLMLTASLELLTPEQRSALAAALPVLEQLADAQGSRLRAFWSLAVGQAAGQFVAFPGDLGQLLLELDDAPDGLQGDALVGHRDDLLDDPDLVAGVAALAAR